MSPPGAVQVWRAGTGSWRWRYLEPPPGQMDAGQAAELPSHKDYPTRDAAVHAARTAYPDVPVHADDPAPLLPAVRPGGCRRTLARLGVVVVLLLTGAAIAARQRRAGSGRRRTVSS